MKKRVARKRFQQRVLVRPQNQQLCDDNGEVVLDFVGRYEDVQRSYDIIFDRIGVPSTTLGQKNTSEHSRYLNYYSDDDLRCKVG